MHFFGRQIDPIIALLCAGIIAIAAAATTAKAASPNTRGPIVKHPVAATAAKPDKSWTGIWIGGNIGYATQTSKVNGEDGGTVSTPFSFYSAADGVTYGAAVGGDLQVQKLVFGIFADWDKTNADATFRIPASSLTLVGDIGIKSMWAVGGRAGYLLTDHVLVYGLAGYTTVNWSVPTAGATGSTGLADPHGLTLGAGIEAMATAGWSMKLEYRFVDLGNDSLKYNVPGPLDALLKADHHLHQVRLGVAYKFDSPIK